MSDLTPAVIDPGVGPTPPPTAAPTCEICGRGPALAIYASKYSGRLLFGDETFWKGTACRVCALSLYRSGLTHCLWAGWWAPIALVVNPRMIWRNATGLRAARRLAEPQGAPLAEPLEVGRPVFARPAALAGVAAPFVIAGLIVAIVLALGTGGRVDELRAGQCLDLPTERTIERVDPIPCSEPHNAEVTGTIPGTDIPPVDLLCAGETAAYLGGDGAVKGLRPAAIRWGTDDPNVVCLITSEGGRPMRGSQRNAAR